MRHNLLPHRNHSIDKELYKTTYEKVDGVVHMGHFSREEFKRRYPGLSCGHAVIPHPSYSVTPSASVQTSRKLANIPQNARVFLVFGTIREFEEQNMVIRAFRKLNLTSKILIFTRGIYKYPMPHIRKSPIKRMLWDWRFYLYSHRMKRHRIRMRKHFLPEESLGHYLSGSDVVIIPRINSLNSGMLPLAFNYGKVVLGADYGNIGEILKDTGNPVFQPDSTDSLVQALEKAYDLSIERQGEKNQKYAEKNWNTEVIGDQHFEFFDRVIRGNTFVKDSY